MKTNPVKRWELERYLLHELPSIRMDEIKKVLETDSDLREELAALERSNEEILKQYPPEAVVPQIKAQLRAGQEDKARQPVLLKRLLYATPVFAAALVVLFIVFQNPGGHTTQDIQGLQGTRIKGIEKIDVSKPHILVHRKINNTVELLESGDKASAGDLLQIAYVSVGATYGVILSIDGRGVVTLHYPESEDKEPILEQDIKTLLPTSYELDDAPDFERFFFITSKSKIDVQTILNSAKVLTKHPKTLELAELDLPDSFSQSSLLIKKGE
ncbi:MAG: hypothetical protein WBE11_15645 [Candidatus Aminicenantaceae bacterium]